MPVRVAVVGAGGFVGRALCLALAGRGLDVIAVSRHPVAFDGPAGIPEPIEQRRADLADGDAARKALAGVSHAVYLLHSMKSGEDFVELDRTLAATFAAAGVERIIYLGGLGAGDLSEHLSSRQDVGRTLGSTGIPVVEFRAAVVLGSGGISFEMLRYLSERLPAMTCPRWVRTRIQPIALGDVLAYLEAGLSCSPGVYEIGGADITTYRDMIQAYASVRRLRRRLIVDLPWLSLSLSAYWVDLVTPVDRTISHSLIQSLTSEVVVTDPAAGSLPVTPVDLPSAIADALSDQAASIDRSLLTLPAGERDGVHVVRTERRVRGLAAEVSQDLAEVGGDLEWYGTPRWWKLRIGLGRLLHEQFPLGKADILATGGTVDWWNIVDRGESWLVLRTFGWRAGDAWLGYAVAGGAPHGSGCEEERLIQVAAFRERGVVGFLYWTLLVPVHHWVFRRMAARRIARARMLRRRNGWQG